jgi:DNA repair photolyase
VAKQAGKAAFGTQEWAKSNVNLLNGCQHDCAYCYAKNMAVRFKRKTPDTWKTPTVNEAALAKDWQKKAGTIMFPSSHDVHPDNLEECLTVLRNLLTAGNNVLIVSKPHLRCIERLCNELKAFRAQILFRFTIGSAWEPNAPAFAERVNCLRYARRKGFATSVSCEPMLDDNIHAVIKAVKPYVTDAVWIGRANRLTGIVAVNSPGDEAVRQKADALKALMSDEYIKALWDRYKDDPKIKWKDSVKKVVKLARPTEKGLDV